MQARNFKNGIIVGLCIIILSLLLFNKCNTKTPIVDNETIESQDSLFYRQWHRERSYRMALVKNFDERIDQIQLENQRYTKTIKTSKQQMKIYRHKADSITALLHKPLKKINEKYYEGMDSTLSDNWDQYSDTINQNVNLLAELLRYQDSSDVKCDTVISLLEAKGISLDSIINFQKSNEIILKSVNEEQALLNNYLTNQLNLANKQQHKKNRQVKLLSAGLLLLGGISTSLFIIPLKK